MRSHIGFHAAIYKAREAASSGSSWRFRGFIGSKTLPLQLFAGELTGAADGFPLLPYSPFGRFFVMAAELISGLVTREPKYYIKSYGNRQTLSDGGEAPLVGTAPVHMGNI
jgi:hypothetical protein